MFLGLLMNKGKKTFKGKLLLLQRDEAVLNLLKKKIIGQVTHISIMNDLTLKSKLKEDVSCLILECIDYSPQTYIFIFSFDLKKNYDVETEILGVSRLYKVLLNGHIFYLREEFINSLEEHKIQSLEIT